MIKEKPFFLEIEEYHFSIGGAKKRVTQALLDFGVKSPKGGWDKASFKIGQQEISFKELVKTVRETGVVFPIQNIIDNNDSFFCGRFGFSTPTMQLGEITTMYAGFSKTLKAPMTDQLVEIEISEDIMFYRQEACLYSNEDDFTFCTRYYRAYLASCIALIDAFINRHILLYKSDGHQSETFDLLQKTSRLEDRLNLFLQVDNGHKIEDINKGVEWIHFKELRRLRNEMTHINSPSLGYSIADFAEHFNYVREGVGGLLKLIRGLQGKTTLSFIEKLRTAPIIYFNEITPKADGNYIVKRKK